MCRGVYGFWNKGGITASSAHHGVPRIEELTEVHDPVGVLLQVLQREALRESRDGPASRCRNG